MRPEAQSFDRVAADLDRLAELAANLVRRGPRIAWRIYRLTTRRAWLDHRVSDRFFGRAELIRCCDALFPGYRLDILSGPRRMPLERPPAAPHRPAARL